MSPLRIRYYHCSNRATAIVIYPKIVDAQDPEGCVIWDGSKESTFSYLISSGSSVIVDLKKTDVSAGTTFLLGETTATGVDLCAAEMFRYDPTSDMMAYGTRHGGMYTGRFVVDYCAPYLPEPDGGLVAVWDEKAGDLVGTRSVASFARTVLDEVFWLFDQCSIAAACAPSRETDPETTTLLRFIGKIKWPNSNFMAAGVLLTVNHLIHKGYSVTHEDNAAIKQSKVSITAPNPHPNPPPHHPPGDHKPPAQMRLDSVPAAVKKDWKDAVAKAKKYSPKDEGITRGP